MTNPRIPEEKIENQGITLVELLVALAVGFSVLAGVGGVFFSAARSAPLLERRIRSAESVSILGELFMEDVASVCPDPKAPRAKKKLFSGREDRVEFFAEGAFAPGLKEEMETRGVAYSYCESKGTGALCREVGFDREGETKAWPVAKDLAAARFAYRVRGDWRPACDPEDPVEAVRLEVQFAGGESYSWVYPVRDIRGEK